MSVLGQVRGVVGECPGTGEGVVGECPGTGECGEGVSVPGRVSVVRE